MDSSLFRKLWLHYMKIGFYFFHSYDLSTNFRTFKKKQAYHFNILKRNLCIIINIWQKLKSSSEQFQSSSLHNVAEGSFIIFPWTQKRYFFLTANMLPNDQLLATLGGGSLTKPMLMTAFATYYIRRSSGGL